MNRRQPRGPIPPKTAPEPRRAWSGPMRSRSRPWVIRLIVAVALAVLVTGIIVAAANGVLFSTSTGG